MALGFDSQQLYNWQPNSTLFGNNSGYGFLGGSSSSAPTNNFTLLNGNPFGEYTPFTAPNWSDVQGQINATPNANTAGEFGFNLPTLQALGGLALSGLQAFSGLQNYKLGKKALGLAQDQFGFQKNMANRNLANQAKIINNTYDTAGSVAAGLVGYKDPVTGRYGGTDQNVVDAYRRQAEKQYVDASPVSS